jgi:diguanylate cyclase (GGDEF)-like protein
MRTSRVRQFFGSQCWQLLLLVWALCSCSSTTAPPSQPKVIAGVLDLRNWDFAHDGPVKLDGDWVFSWNTSRRTLADSKTSEFIRVPGAWTTAGHPARGKALYRLRVLTKPDNRLYGLKLFEFPQSYRLYVEQHLLIENGHYSEAPELISRTLVRPYVVFAHSSGRFEIAIEAVNLNEDDPGPRRSLILGLESDIRKIQENQLIADMVVVGVLFIMGLYHLGLYLQRRRETGSLLFGLLCLIMIFRIGVTEEHYLHKYFPAFPGMVEHTLDRFSFFILAPIFTWIFSYFFKEEFHGWVVKAVTAIFLGFSAIYLAFPAPLLFNFYLFFTLLIGAYLLVVLLISVKRRRSGSGIFLIGFLLFAATSIWDMLSYSNIVRSIYVSQIGFVAFIFAQANVLSTRFNRALVTSEQLTLNLETIVAERTSALEQSNRKLAALNVTDALTGISNRRHFDDMLQSEWSRALRGQRPLALLILDIDHFKAYNDHYGHQAGDMCLQKVAEVLASIVSRAGDTLARYGGEEFVVLLPESTQGAALAIAETIRSQISAAALPHLKSDFHIVSVSIGVRSVTPTATDSADQFFKMADEALYEAKRQGRNRIC